MRTQRESVVLRRPVVVERIPDGTRFELEPGVLGTITQALGSHFSLVVEGQLVRLRGTDADAIGKPVPDPGHRADGEPAAGDLQAQIWRTLATCYDPEIPVDIVELGLVYDCQMEPDDSGGSKVVICMTLTAPGCGMGDLLAEEVADKVLALDGVAEVRVDMVFEPPWDRSRMSDAARLELGL